MPVWGYVALYALAITRVTVFVTKDSMTKPFRRWLDKQLSPLGIWLHDLLTCPWCLSVWVAAAAVALVVTFGWLAPWLLYPALILAFSQVAGMLAPVGRTED